MTDDTRPTVKFRMLDQRIDELTRRINTLTWRIEELEAKDKPQPPQPPQPNTEAVFAVPLTRKA